MIKLLEVDLNLWFVILKVSLIFNFLFYTGSFIAKWQMYFIDFGDFGSFKWNKNYFFDDFMHKTFWWILMHNDTFWSFRVKKSWKLQNKMFLKNFILPGNKSFLINKIFWKMKMLIFGFFFEKIDKSFGISNTSRETQRHYMILLDL